MGMWLEYAWVTDHVLGRRRGMGPDARSLVSWSNEKRGMNGLAGHITTALTATSGVSHNHE